jgi:hypothetical protein
LDAVASRHLRDDPIQQSGTFVGKRFGPCGQRLFDIVLCSRPVEVETERSEFLDFVGGEP